MALAMLPLVVTIRVIADTQAVSEFDDLRVAIPGLRSQLKALARTTRTSLQLLADFEERLERALEDAQPEEAQRDQHERRSGGDGTEIGRRVAAAIRL